MTTPSADIGAPFRWALEDTNSAAMALANWLAREVDPGSVTAVDLLTNPRVELATLHQAKDAYKTLRVSGETTGDRRIAAQLYLATIAAGIVRHGERISAQSDGALERSLAAMKRDLKLPMPLRHLAEAALEALPGVGPAPDH